MKYDMIYILDMQCLYILIIPLTYISLHIQLFSGATTSTLRCKHCQHRSHKYERFYDLSLTLTPSQFFTTSSSSTAVPIDSSVTAEGGHNSDPPVVVVNSSRRSRNSDSINLLDCLREFTHQELLTQHVVCVYTVYYVYITLLEYAYYVYKYVI